MQYFGWMYIFTCGVMPSSPHFMGEPNLNAEGDFLVRESIGLNYTVGVLLLLVFAASMAMGDYGWSHYMSALALLLIPAALYLAKGRRNAVSIRINKSGFYCGGKLVTDWVNFFDATITEDAVPGSFQDHFFLFIRYYKASQAGLYARKIRLSNTQDKSEEEIIAAIRFYSKVSREMVDLSK